MSNQAYNIPTVPSDLRREETIRQIADALDYLNKVANDVFTRISNKVQDNRLNLQKINDRVNLAQARIDKVRGSKKATKVFSSAKYPAPDVLQEYTTVFNADNPLHEQKKPHYKVQSKHNLVDDRVLRDKLNFFNVPVNNKRKKDSDQGEGLGGLPRTIVSVSSLLLFNTSENP